MTTYDNDKVFEAFLKEREDPHTPYNMQVKPIMLDYIGNVSNKSVLDIGC